MPNNLKVRKEYDLCLSAVRKVRFEAAIASDVTKLASEMDLSQIGKLLKKLNN